MARSTDNADLIALLGEAVERFTFGERLRLAASLLDDVKAGRSSDPVASVRHARSIITTVNHQLLEELKRLQ